jgi:hypothetical protein
MKDIPSDILKQFCDMLKKRSVPATAHSYYLKWLRYYLDYCATYSLTDTSSKYLSQFLQKLNEKKQAEFQQKQAGHAVSICLDMERANAKIPNAGKASAPVQSCLCEFMPSGAGQTYEAAEPLDF